MDIIAPLLKHGYEVQGKIGAGAYSEVYKVFHSKFDQHFAAKVLREDPVRLDRSRDAYEAEIESLLHLNHRNIIRLYAHFHETDADFLILELCSKGTLLDSILASEEPMALSRFIDLSRRVVDALVFCHSRGIAHRDIKPVNIFIDEFDRVKLADFGIALIGRAAKQARRQLGTGAYLPPESWLGEQVDFFKADVWSLGVTFAYMLNGRLPWPVSYNGQIDVRELGTAICSGNWRINRLLPVEITGLIGKMLTVKVDERPTIVEVSQNPLFAVDVRPMGLRAKSASRQVCKPRFKNNLVRWPRFPNLM
jgi:serine/threonine protein kinase